MSRLLIVDQDPHLGELQRTLEPEAARWDVSFVGSAAEAWGLLDGRHFDVVVAGLSVPGLGPGQFLHEVRRRYPGAARVVLAGSSGDGDPLTAVAVAHQCIARRNDLEGITRAVERALRLHEQVGPEPAGAEPPQLEHLPSLPGTIQELLALLESHDVGPRDVAAVVERDVALSVKVLQLVNSSFFAGRTRITTVETATIRLGIPTIRSLVMLDEVVRAVELPHWLARRWLWRLNAHAVETARLARRLAPPELRDSAFCAGLLHECGQLIFAAARPELFVVHLRLREEEARSLSDIEQEAFGVSHGPAGAYLLDQWGFPPEMADAALHHQHAPATTELSSPTLPSVVHIAHTLVEAERLRICSAAGDPGVDEAELARLGLLPQVLCWRAEGQPITDDVSAA